MPDPPRRHPVAFWSAVILAVLLLGGGAAVAGVAWSATAGPDGVVRAYFAALARGDAATALAYGDVPTGSRALLTDDVLHEQLRIAALRDVHVGRVRTSGERSRVSVDYRLDFAGAPIAVDASVAVRAVDGDWRLDRSAVTTQLNLSRAGQRAGILGRAVPAASTAVFPGAVPLSFDTPYLQLVTATAHVEFGAGPTTLVDVAVSASGRTAAIGATSAALGRCLKDGAPASSRCPLPSERTVPGTFRGRVVGTSGLQASLAPGPAGLLAVDGSVRATVSYRRLTFDGRKVTERRTLALPVSAQLYASRIPLAVTWARPA